MTPQEAIERIYIILKNCEFTRADKKSLITAISALEKQIPKKPIAEKNEIDTLDDYFCPYCRSFLDEEPKCCDTCGQALDWSE